MWQCYATVYTLSCSVGMFPEIPVFIRAGLSIISNVFDLHYMGGKVIINRDRFYNNNILLSLISRLPIPTGNSISYIVHTRSTGTTLQYSFLSTCPHNQCPVPKVHSPPYHTQYTNPSPQVVLPYTMSSK